jgi:hypothetical protein
MAKKDKLFFDELPDKVKPDKAEMSVLTRLDLRNKKGDAAGNLWESAIGAGNIKYQTLYVVAGTFSMALAAVREILKDKGKDLDIISLNQLTEVSVAYVLHDLSSSKQRRKQERKAHKEQRQAVA